MMLITKPDYQKRIGLMEAEILAQLTELLLHSDSPIFGGATQLAERKRCLISLLPSDDNWTVIPQRSSSAVLDKENPGCEITIERIE